VKSVTVPAFLWMAQTQSGFKESVRRKQCDQKQKARSRCISVPPSKMGCVTLAPMSRKPLPAENMLPKARAMLPMSPVRLKLDTDRRFSCQAILTSRGHLPREVAEEKYSRHLLRVIRKLKCDGHISDDARHVDFIFPDVQVRAAFARSTSHLNAIMTAASFAFRFEQQPHFVRIARLAFEAGAFPNLAAVVAGPTGLEQQRHAVDPDFRASRNVGKHPAGQAQIQLFMALLL